MQFTVSGTKALNHGRPHINFVIFRKESLCKLTQGRCGFVLCSFLCLGLVTVEMLTSLNNILCIIYVRKFFCFAEHVAIILSLFHFCVVCRCAGCSMFGKVSKFRILPFFGRSFFPKPILCVGRYFPRQTAKEGLC